MRRSGWKAPIRRTDRQAGFTLFEVLVTLAITALFVATVLPFASRLVARWSGGERVVQEADAWMRMSIRLSADLAETVPLAMPVTGQQRMFFRAGRRGVVFVRPARTEGAGALQIVAYMIQSGPAGDTLVAYTTSYSPGLIDVDPQAFGTATAVLAGPFRLAFTVVGADGVRVEEWRNIKELPPRIELSAVPVGPGRVPAAPLVLMIPSANPLIPGAVAAR